jgi:hypothetical protein
MFVFVSVFVLCCIHVSRVELTLGDDAERVIRGVWRQGKLDNVSGECLCICVFVFLCICVFVYLCICVFVYLCICVFVYCVLKIVCVLCCINMSHASYFIDEQTLK